jgi:hypothetical protein
MKVYRGTQTPDPGRTRKKGFAPSYTSVLPVAIIWSAHPGDEWDQYPPAFTGSSTVHAAELRCRKLLDLRKLGTYCAFSEVLRLMNYGKNKHWTIEEVLKVYNYLHNRITGRAPGGEFKYRVMEEPYSDHQMSEDDVPWDLMNPETLISWHAHPEFEMNPSLDSASILIADTFIFIDSPGVRRVAKAMGYDCIVYMDVFHGAEEASKLLLGIDVEDIPGIQEEEDIDWDYVPSHDTVRPLNPDTIRPLWSRPSEEVVEVWKRTHAS